ncbi:MAG: YraN family protein [Candidatus Eremiobacteraeota bacterium]|nr:YraN family protein [Candidatus Eremiobacteraeota bacterium]
MTRNSSLNWQALRKSASTVLKGRNGEDRAAAFLQERGYHVMQKNVRLPGGEIDLVCKDGETIVFIEVKLRTTASYGSALAAVDSKKRATLRRLAADYLQFAAPQAQARFDVVALDGDRLILHRNAF